MTTASKDAAVTGSEDWGQQQSRTVTWHDPTPTLRTPLVPKTLGPLAKHRRPAHGTQTRPDAIPTAVQQPHHARGWCMTHHTVRWFPRDNHYEHFCSARPVR
jgi:hypothetical protein